MLHAMRANSNVVKIALFALSVLFVASTPAPLAAKERIMLILDSSGSMWGQVNGVNKHIIAREVIGTVLGDIDEDIEMGVMAYGHRRKGDCGDIQTLVPVGPVNTKQIVRRINKIQPRGKTPISASVRRAAEALKYSEEKATIVLVSDGLETCDADPCALATELEQLGVDFTVHVVGFDLGNEDTATLSCLADNTGGKFLQASDADELSDAFGEVVEAAQEPEPEPVVQAEAEPEPEPAPGPTLILPRAYLVEGGERLDKAYFRVYAPEADADGKRKQITYGGGKPKLKAAPGKYYITAKHGDAIAGVEVEIAEGQQNVVDIVLNAGLIQPVAYLADGVEPLADAYFRVYGSEKDNNGNAKQVTYGGGKPRFTVPAGPHHVTAKRGDALAGIDVEIQAGEVHKVHIVLNAGIIIPMALWSEDGDPIKDAYYRVYETKEDANGKRKQVTYGGGAPKFTVAAGEYYITAKVGDALIGQTIAVAPGEATEVTLVLGAGVLKPAAYYTEGGDPIKDAYFRVYEAEADADGKRRQVTYGGGSPNFKVPAGTYYITAQVGDSVVGRDVEVMPGQATEVAIILNAGILNPKAYYAEGEDPIKDAYFRVYEAEAGTDGKRKQVAYGGGANRSFKLPAGKYYITAKVGDAIIGKDVEVKGGEALDVAMVLGAGILIPRAYYTEGGEQVKKAYFRVYEAKQGPDGKRKEITRGGGANRQFKLTAGTYYVTAKIGEAIVGEEVEVQAGQPTEVSLVLGAGVLSLFASAVEGGDTVKKVYYRVYAAKKDIEGNRKQVSAGGGQPKFQLPAGKYVVTATWGKAVAQQEVEVTAGELTEATINLNAGRVVIQAVDAGGEPIVKGVYYRLFAAKKDIEGKRKQILAGGGKSMEGFVPAGKYVAQIYVGGRKEVSGALEIDVEAGALVEVQVPAASQE